MLRKLPFAQVLLAQGDVGAIDLSCVGGCAFLKYNCEPFALEDTAESKVFSPYTVNSHSGGKVWHEEYDLV